MERNNDGEESGWRPDWRKLEALGILALVLLAVYFLAVSWRKWPDPIADSGLQWYAFWRLAQGALLYHDVTWNYGPLSAYFNAGLFRIFGPGMMVLVTANLVIYGLLASLAYAAFRKAWGRLGAFTALAVFISVFSFSRLNAIGNYNYATPYAHESTQGMLLILLTVFITVRWCRGVSRTLAFFLGLCGGLAAVLKPEFMLAGGVLGIAACVLRWRQNQRVQPAEYGLVLGGLALPTLAFTVWFAGVEPWGNALIDASRAWWMVVGDKAQRNLAVQQTFMGLDHPWASAIVELNAAGRALAGIAAIWAAGWFLTRPLPMVLRLVLALGAGVLAYYCGPEGGWFQIGACLPGLMVIILILLAAKLIIELRQKDYAQEGTVMAMALALVAVAMLARMPLRARIHHLGFYQAALAGMVVTAFMVANVPRWMKSGGWGRLVATAGCVIALAMGCGEIAWQSQKIRADQTQPVGSGRDRFYADAPDIDATGSLVNWTVERLESLPPQATVCVLPDGLMINYLARRRSPLAAFPTEEELVKDWNRRAPDCVVFISRDLGEYGVKAYGTTNGPGHLILKWLHANHYDIDSGQGGDPLAPQDPGVKKGVLILRPATTQTNAPGAGLSKLE
jgi:hypothetical protein